MATNYPVFSFPHNWSDGFTETLEWMTVILTSQTGAEQRYRQRQAPRRFFEYTVLLTAAQRSYFDLQVMKYGAQTWLIPVTHDVERVTVALPVGTTRIAMDTDSREFVGSSRALVVNDDARTYEIIRIDQVVEDGLRLVVGTTKTWGPGARIYPLIKGKFTEQPQLTRKGDGTFVGSMKFLSQDENDWPIGTNLNILVNADGLIVNAFQPDSGRQAYFDQASGTSEGQFLLIMGMLDAWYTLGRSDARDLAQRMLNAAAHTTYGGKYPPATITTTDTFAPHWLFVVKKPIKASTINYDDVFQFASGRCEIPDKDTGPTRLVFQVVDAAYSLLWKNPYSSLLVGKTYPIASYSYDAVNEKTVVLLTQPITAELGVIYSSQNGNRLDVGDRYEAWPDWRPLAANEIDCAADTMNWAYRAFVEAAAVFSGNPYYAAAAEATRQQAAIVYDINDSRDWIKPSFTKNPFGDGSRFQSSSRGSPVSFDADESGNVVMLVPTGTGEIQYGNASINDTYKTGDYTEVNIGSTRPVVVSVFIDPTATYNPATRYSCDVSLAGNGTLQTFNIQRTQFKNPNGDVLPLNSVVYTFGVSDRNTKNHTVIIGRVRQHPNNTIPYYKGAIPFTANFLGSPSAVLIDWRGPIYMGYQSTVMWQRIGDATATGNCMQLLEDAQTAYYNAIGITGPFAPVFYFPRSDAYSYGTPSTFGFIGPDPNTGWGGYQYRPLAEVAETYYLDAGSEPWHAQAKNITMRFLTYLDGVWPMGGGPPTDYPATGPGQINYQEPHFTALIMRAAMFIDQKDRPSQTGAVNSTIASILAKGYAHWNAGYVDDNGRMDGTFFNFDPTTPSWFGFWHGEIMRTMRQYINWTAANGLATQNSRTRYMMSGMVDWALANTLPAPQPTIYQGHLVLDTPPDFSGDLSFNYNRMINEQDSKIALPLDDDAAGKGFPSQAHNWFLVGRDQMAGMRDLLYYCQGRLTPVWIPTYMNDLPLLATTFRGSSSLLVDYIGYSDGMQDMFNRVTIAMQMYSGAMYFANIIDAVRNPDGSETIHMDTAAPEDLSRSTLKRISFMTLSRLDTDSVDLKFSTNNQGVAQVGITTKAVGDFRNPSDWTPPPFPAYQQVQT